ncbi:hypothetical protein DSO57_1027526 [Entomophthora muscae]|uniref:Uncharacterized protein n=1 Tax=Entomophthora muscae TaxID=34485 RepID=A0ACC2RGJ8_9FUNG|nr:hypothetical protein DSO57_1027526 [Entomophthora muscae]
MARINRFAPDYTVLSNKESGIFGVSERINNNNALRLEQLKAAFASTVGKLESPPFKSASSLAAFMEGALLQTSSIFYMLPSLQLTALGKVLPVVVGDDLTAFSVAVYYLVCDAAIVSMLSPFVACVVSANYLSCKQPDDCDEDGYTSSLSSSANRSFIN